jgi:hypothetical protein
VLTEAKWICSMEEIECFQGQGLESEKWSEVNLKWGEDQLNMVKGIKVRGLWSVYKDSEVEWGVDIGTMCVIEYGLLTA